jgi:hypothetical protein
MDGEEPVHGARHHRAEVLREEALQLIEALLCASYSELPKDLAALMKSGWDEAKRRLTADKRAQSRARAAGTAGIKIIVRVAL